MSHRNHRKKGEQENGCILLLSFASVFINPTGINWEKSVKNMTLNFKSPQISHNRKLNKIKEEKRWNVNVVEVVAAEEAEHTGTLLVHHLPLYTRINEAGKRKTEKRKKERGEKQISLIYLWCNEGMLNASEQAAVVRLSKKMKCLHSWAGEGKRERRAEPEVVLWQGVNHLASMHTQTTDHQNHHQLSHQHLSI